MNPRKQESSGHDRRPSTLKLRKETLLELDDAQLEQVAGGKHKDNHTRGRRCDCPGTGLSCIG